MPPTPSPTSAHCLHAPSESDADLLYATGMFFPDPVFWFRKGWRTYLVVRPLELGRAKLQSRTRHVIDYAAVQQRLRRRTGGAPSEIDVYVEILRERGVESVVVPDRFPLKTADGFRKAGISVTASGGSFFPEREVKRADELASIAVAQTATEQALTEALDVLRATRNRRGFLYHKGEKVTSESLRRVVDVSLMRNGCVAKHTIVASGDQCVNPHDVGSGPIRANTSVIFDVFPRHAATGYFADMSRTVVRGKASKKLREIYDLVHEGQRYAFDRIRGGVDAQAVHFGIVNLFKSAGWPTATKDGVPQGFIHGTGHGVGLDIHELPTFGRGPSTLPTGAVVTVEPGLYYRGIGGVRLEDMVLVTDEGCENLTSFPKELEL